MSRHCPNCGFEFRARSLTTQTRDQLFLENMKLKKENNALRIELKHLAAAADGEGVLDRRALENRLRCEMEAMSRTANQLMGTG